MSDIQIIQALKTRVHPEQKFTNPFMDYIFGRGLLNCTDFHHPYSCSQFYWFKLKE